MKKGKHIDFPKTTLKFKWTISFFNEAMTRHISVSFDEKPSAKHLKIIRNEACMRLNIDERGIHGGLEEGVEIQWEEHIVNLFWNKSGRYEKKK